MRSGFGVLFHGKRHPRELGAAEVSRFLEQLAQTEKDPLRAMEQAREALQFLYEELLRVPLEAVALPEPPRLLDRIRRALRVRHYSPRTEDCYVTWAVRYIRFHGLRHPNTMGAAEMETLVFCSVYVFFSRMRLICVQRGRPEVNANE